MRNLADLLSYKRWFVLTGAGCSTDSGIPAYRDELGRWLHRAPIHLSEFVGDPGIRQRYWARSMIGYARVQQAQANAAHHALASLESEGYVGLLVTQNVDGLHEQAGSRSIVALHGRIGDVVCLRCGAAFSRDEVQTELLTLNPAPPQNRYAPAPDGDAAIEDKHIKRFRMVDCFFCGGILKPDVVFFGEGVPKARVTQCYGALDTADLVVVVGSSLTVFSGYRFVKHAYARAIPIVLINRGQTRGDALASLRIDATCAPVLSELAARAREH